MSVVLCFFFGWEVLSSLLFSFGSVELSWIENRLVFGGRLVLVIMVETKKEDGIFWRRLKCTI